MIRVKIIKKNQIFLFVCGLILVSLGYLYYTHNHDEYNYISTTSNSIETNAFTEANIDNPSIVVEEIENTINQETVDVVQENEEELTNDYFTNSKIERNKMYSEMLENYQSILNNSNVSNEQKTIATNEILKINNLKNSIMIVENLIISKAVEDAVVLINGDSVNVVLKTAQIDSSVVAQVQNIVERELNADIENIHISIK